MDASLGTQDEEALRGQIASSGQPWPGAVVMVTETVVEQVVAALARGEAVAAVAPAYGLGPEDGPDLGPVRWLSAPGAPSDGATAGSVSGVDTPARPECKQQVLQECEHQGTFALQQYPLRGGFMKRRLWIVGMSLLVLLAARARPVEAKVVSACIAYSCTDANGCDPFCSCQYLAVEAGGTCGGV